VLRDWSTPENCAPRARETKGNLPFESAAWQGDELAVLTSRLAERGVSALATLSLDRRLELWHDVVTALLDPDSTERAALFPALVDTARLSPEGLSEALEVVAGGAGSAAAASIAERLPSSPPAPGVDGVVLASNVPGLAVQSLLPALLAGRPLLLRSSRREPLFAPALVDALVAREPALADAFAAVSWPSADDRLTAAAFDGTRRLLAYGDDAALGSLAARFGERIVTLGPRASVGLLAGDADLLSAGRAFARDIALLDQRGCLSVQAVYVVGDARELAAALAFGLALEHRRLPPGPAEPAIAARVQQLRGEAALSGRLIDDLPTVAGTVVIADGLDFEPVPGLRTVRVHRVGALEDALAALDAWRGRLQGAALAGEEAVARGDEIAGRLELARVAAAGALQHAEAGWASGGIDPLTVFS